MHVDVVPSNILLLLSKESMKLNFKNNTITAFGQPINLIVTKSGHYAIPVTNNKHILSDLNTTHQHFTLTLTNNKTDKDIAMKLHRQFAHPTSNKLIKLINSACQEWRNNENLKAEILKVTNKCNTCQIFKKPSPRPVVGLPMASLFLACVALDLTFY